MLLDLVWMISDGIAIVIVGLLSAIGVFGAGWVVYRIGLLMFGGTTYPDYHPRDDEDEGDDWHDITEEERRDYRGPGQRRP